MSSDGRRGFTLIDLLGWSRSSRSRSPCCRRRARRRIRCTNNMKQMDLALFNYQSAMGVFPPTFTAQGRAGKCTQNWGRTWSNSIMPYLEQGNKYNAL